VSRKRPPAEAEESQTLLANALSATGLRATRQRLAVLRLLRATEGHPTVLELHRLLGSEHPNLSRKTVYEILDSFVREGLAACVTDGGEPYRYEARTSPHYHARCRICGHLYDLPARADGPIRGLAAVPEGFRVDAISVTLRGVCMRCHDEI
jgi:Fur family transcriptional regulator, peroxide stress response regulator